MGASSVVTTILCAHATRSKCVDLDRPVTWAWCWLSDSRQSTPMLRRFWSSNSGFMKSQGVQGVFLAALPYKLCFASIVIPSLFLRLLMCCT
jgi:hypothetical protein